MEQRYFEYLEQVEQLRRKAPSLRRGQAMYNILHDTDFEFAGEILGGGLDPYYDDNVIPSFLEALRDHWGVKLDLTPPR